MMTRTQSVLYLTFIVTLAIWFGAAVHDSIGGHPVWYADPVAWVRAPIPVPSPMNAWPFTTAALGLSTLAALASLARYRGDGRGQVLVVLGVTLAVLVATGTYFVPTLGVLADHAALTDAEVVRISRQWMQFNGVRLVILLWLLIQSLRTLVTLSRHRRHA
jgi:hypothetical protein